MKVSNFDKKIIMLNEKFKILRKQKKLTQTQLAKKAKISLSYYAKYEKGIYNINPTEDVLNRIAKALDHELTLMMK